MYPKSHNSLGQILVSNIILSRVEKQTSKHFFFLCLLSGFSFKPNFPLANLRAELQRYGNSCQSLPPPAPACGHCFFQRTEDKLCSMLLTLNGKKRDEIEWGKKNDLTSQKKEFLRGKRQLLGVSLELTLHQWLRPLPP